MTPEATAFLHRYRLSQDAEWERLFVRQAELGDLLQQNHAVDTSTFDAAKKIPDDMQNFLNEVAAEDAKILEEVGRKFDEVGDKTVQSTEDRKEILKILGGERKAMSRLRYLNFRAERQLGEYQKRRDGKGDGVGGGGKGDSAEGIGSLEKRMN